MDKNAVACALHPNSPQVGIVGTFDVRNYGDLLFPLIAQAELERRIADIRLDAYSPTVPEGDWPFPVRPTANLVSDARSMSALLIGGGQLVRFDSTYPFTLPDGGFPPDAYLLHPGLAAEAAGVPIVWNAIGAWAGSPSCPVREMELGRLVAQSKIVAVRDEVTRQKFKSLAPDAEVEWVPDTAFGLSALWSKSESSGKSTAWQKALGLSGPYIIVQADRRIAVYRETLVRLQQRLGARVVLLPVCYCHGDRSEGFPALPGDTDRLGGWPTPHEIREIIAGAQLVVASSLHAMITAISYGVRVARVSYPYERKFEMLAGFEGIARLDDPADLERLLAVGNRVEPRLLDYQARLKAYWDRVASVVNTGERLPERDYAPPNAPAPQTRRPMKVEARAAAGRLARMLKGSAPAISATGRPSAYQDRRILDFDGIRHSPFYAEPFRWGHQTTLFKPDDASRLAEEYPTSGFWTIAGKEPDRHYRFIARSLIAMGATRLTTRHGLSDAWRAFTLDLLSPEYRAAVSEAVGLDLTHALLEANLTQYGPGHELSPHLDLKEKLVTQIFYFNKDWTIEDGGCLAIKSGKDDEGNAALIPPAYGTSAMLVRSHKSWHSVTPVSPSQHQQRRSLNVIFHLPGSKSSMWPQWPIASRRLATSALKTMIR